ncbi:MAG TPA: apolipoprotein N-acyltransferase [Fimbriimonadaceae bacterium]|nr:apolipoprotein N-acyltransferase [Fimbriimonadaceae bacterium]
MRRLPKIWPAAASGLMVVACFPPFPFALLVFVALVPWLLYLRECDGKKAFRSGMLFGLIFWLGEFSFIAGFVSHWTGSVLLGGVPYLAGCLVGSLYFALFGWLANLCYRRCLAWAAPIVWAGVEVLRSYVFGLAFPFGLLAMPLTPAPAIIQSAHYGSVYLVSAWVALANVMIAELMSGKKYSEVRWYGMAFLLVLALSLVRYGSEPTGTLRHVVAGQPGVDLAFGNPEGMEGRVAAAIDRISEAAKGADLLVLPEGVIGDRTTIPPYTMFKVSKDLPVVFGGQFGLHPSYQTAFSYDGHWEHANKTRLVIFGEYVPFRSLLPADFRLPAGDLTPGDKVTTLNVGKFRVGEALCFEGLFPDVSYQHALNGANILAVMSIDDWYFGTNAPEQLRDATNWRAIETGLPAVRAASLGFSMIVDSRGRTVAQAPLYGTRIVGATVKVPTSPDVFPLFPVFPYLAVLSLIAIPAYHLGKRR